MIRLVKTAVVLLVIAGVLKLFILNNQLNNEAPRKVQEQIAETFTYNEQKKTENFIQDSMSFRQHIEKAESLDLQSLQNEVESLERALSNYSNRDYDRFTEAELNKYNLLNRIKTVYLKAYIFKKAKNKKYI